MRLPSARGPLSGVLFGALGSEPHRLPAWTDRFSDADIRSEDFQISLWVLQELSFRPIEGVSAHWESEPSFVSLRDLLERTQEAALRRAIRPPQGSDDVCAELVGLLQRAGGPSLSSWMEEHGELDHMREFVQHRAPYQLKEADAHSFAIPRLAAGPAKSALLKIQLDEYGDTEPGQSHAELFRDTMAVLDVGLDLDVIPASSLRTNTVLNAFGRHRRLLGACLGHLAVFEMTSVEPMARYAATLRRLLPTAKAAKAARFYDVHVAADAFHGQLALDELARGFVAQYPDEADELLFGAAVVTEVEKDFAAHLLQAWQAGRSSLRNAALSAVA